MAGGRRAWPGATEDLSGGEQLISDWFVVTSEDTRYHCCVFDFPENDTRSTCSQGRFENVFTISFSPTS